MSKIVNNFLLVGDKSLPEMHLRQPGFAYSSCGLFPRNKERIQKFKETGDSRYIYQSQLDKACFQLDMNFGDFKNLNRRTASDKIFYNKSLNIAKNLKYNGYQRRLASMIYKFLARTVKIENISNKELAEKLNKPIIKKLKKRKVHSTSIDNICGANLADMQLIKKFAFYCFFLIFSVNMRGLFL